LDFVARNVPHLLIQDLAARLTDTHTQAHDRVAVNVGHAFNGRMDAFSARFEKICAFFAGARLFAIAFLVD
jgi:hypothetical protein